MVYRTFPFRLHHILDEVSKDEQDAFIISWTPSGDTFKIHDLDGFKTEILPKYLPKQNKYKSFKRQLQYYGFTNYGANHYGHPSFLRGQKNLICQIEHRAFKKPKIERSLSPSPATAENDVSQVASTTSSTSYSISTIAPSKQPIKRALPDVFSLPTAAALQTTRRTSYPNHQALSAEMSLPIDALQKLLLSHRQSQEYQQHANAQVLRALALQHALFAQPPAETAGNQLNHSFTKLALLSQLEQMRTATSHY